MDVSPYIDDITIAPKAVFDELDARRTRVRFMLPEERADGTRDWSAMTWGAFAAQIRDVGLFLESWGFGAGDRGAMLGHNSVPWMSSALGVQGVGGVMVPIYPSSTPEQIAYILEHSEARVLFVDDVELLGRVLRHWDDLENSIDWIVGLDAFDPVDAIVELVEAGHGAPSPAAVEQRFVSFDRVRSIGGAMAASSPTRFEALMEAVDVDRPGLMLYTSGTTGRPKGVPLTHRNVGANGNDWMQVNAPLIEDDPIDLLWLPLSHAFGFGEVCLGNTLGFTTYWSDPGSALLDLPVVRPNIFMSIPRYFEKLATTAMAEETPEAQRRRLAEVTGGELTFCLSGGAGLKREVKEFFYEHGTLIIEGYGLTEASPTLTLNRPDDFRFDTVGKPLPSVEIELADDGEILARGPNIFEGYYKNEEATRETFTDDGWLETGDLGEWTEDGFLKIVGRKKEILVTAGGKNIPPAHIETRFQDDPFIAHLVVYGDEKPYLVAGVWADEAAAAAALEANDIAPTPVALRDLLQERIDAINEELARHETIKKFKVFEEPLTVEGGMLTPTLKVKRNRVYDVYREDFEEMY
jgi:long-chain acyl-CoA synthetase